MKDLIERLEKATEGSRELDAEIAYHFVSLLPGVTMHKESVPGSDVFAFWKYGVCYNCSRWEPFTTSLDAALTLVPSRLGIMWDVAKYPGESAAAYVGQRDVPMRQFVPAKTPALALCIASLKALMATKEEAA